MSPDTQPRFHQEEVMHQGEYQPQAILVGVPEDARQEVEDIAKSEQEPSRFKESDFSQSFYVLR
jgi:hypothetical protein